MQSPRSLLLPPLIEFPRPIWDKGRASEEWRIPHLSLYCACRVRNTADFGTLGTKKARNLARASLIPLQNGNTVEIGRLVTPPSVVCI